MTCPPPPRPDALEPEQLQIIPTTIELPAAALPDAPVVPVVDPVPLLLELQADTAITAIASAKVIAHLQMPRRVIVGPFRLVR
jgi:hypothetical protein